MLCDRQTDGRMCSARNTFVMSIKNLTIMQLRDWERPVVKD